MSIRGLQRVWPQVRKFGQYCELRQAWWQALAQLLNPLRAAIAEELGGLRQIGNTLGIQTH
jgi:hypothetical protein